MKYKDNNLPHGIRTDSGFIYLMYKEYHSLFVRIQQACA